MFEYKYVLVPRFKMCVLIGVKASMLVQISEYMYVQVCVRQYCYR